MRRGAGSWGETCLAVWVGTCLAVFVGVSLRWPLVGDATYLHYAVLLMRHGMRPYADVVDMNLPGAYLLEAGVMRVFGGGSVGWRVWDLGLLVVAGGAMRYLLRSRGWAAGLVAAGMFALLHGQDGVIMAGERDFLVAVLLVAAVALLVAGVRGTSGWWWVGFGVLAGWAVSVKPTAGLVPVVGVVWMIGQLRSRGAAWRGAVGLAVAGLLVPVVVQVVWLGRWGSVGAFAGALTGIVRYHAGLGHRPMAYLVTHAVAPVGVMVGVWLVCWAALGLRRGWVEGERWLLLGCAAAGWVSYVAQAKGFSYQRYPFLVFLLVVMVGDLSDCLGGCAMGDGGWEFRGWLWWRCWPGSLCGVWLRLIDGSRCGRWWGIWMLWVAKGCGCNAWIRRGRASMRCMRVGGCRRRGLCMTAICWMGGARWCRGCGGDFGSRWRGGGRRCLW